MTTKNVTSKDPRKPVVLAALKAAAGGTKITNVQDDGGGWFSGDAFKLDRAGRENRDPGRTSKWAPLGRYQIYVNTTTGKWGSGASRLGGGHSLPPGKCRTA